MGDLDLLTQVLINLIPNAIKFSPEHSEINIEVLTDNSMLIFKVIDQVSGISETQKSNLFKPFQQLKHTEHIKSPGAGLGLSICKMIIDLHEGQIGLTSQKAEGSVFWFGIPLKLFFKL